MVGPRDKLDAAIARVDAAMKELHTAGEVLLGEHSELRKRRDSVVQLRVEVARVKRGLEEAREEMTPCCPSGETASQAFEASRKHSERAMSALKGRT